MEMYEPEDAAKMTYEYLSSDVKERLSMEDAVLILDLEFAYLEKVGLIDKKEHPSGEPVLINERMNVFIREMSQKQGKVFSDEDIDAVLGAEEVYMRHIGIIE